MNNSTPDQNLQALLQAAIDVELFTIPLYMTAAYSLRFTQASAGVLLPTAPEPLQGSSLTPNQSAFNILFSVFVQEMLHLEMACNLSNALGFSPTLNPPDYTTGKLPHIQPPPPGITVALGPLDRDRLNLFTYIETPNPSGVDPNPLAPPYVEPAGGFPTIGALYNMLRASMESLWSSRYRANSVQQSVFTDAGKGPAYQYETLTETDPVKALALANNIINEIVFQGEGSDAAGDVPLSFQPDLSGEKNINDAKVRELWDKISHYARFKNDLAPLVGNVELWPGNQDLPPYYYDPKTQADLETVLDVGWTQLLSAMNASFQTGAPFPFAAMSGFNTRIVLVWASGGTPTFPVKPQPQNEGKEIIELHACQGLNACQGHGRDGTGSGPGDGDCATAIFHDCGNNNSCRGQGGCGWNAVKDINSPLNWVPGENSCTGVGGCGAPIPTQQIFHAGPYNGQSVWDQARTMFVARMNLIGQSGNVQPAPDPNDLRKALLPT